MKCVPSGGEPEGKQDAEFGFVSLSTETVRFGLIDIDSKAYIEKEMTDSFII